MSDKRRQTGRTSRLIAEAVRMKSEGKRVAVIFSTMGEVHEFQLKTNCCVKAFSASSQEWSWDEFRVYGLPLDTEYLVDHHAIESRFSKILRAYHRFDFAQED